MTVTWFCTQGCTSNAECKYRSGKSCVYEYNASDYKPEHQWCGDEPPPSRWQGTDGTTVYRTFSDFCD